MDKSSLVWICLVIFGTCTAEDVKQRCHPNQLCTELRTFGEPRRVSPCRCNNFRRPNCHDATWENNSSVMTYMGGTELTEGYKFFQLKFCMPIFKNKPLCKRSNSLIVIGAPDTYFIAKPECGCPNNTYKLTRVNRDWSKTSSNVRTYFFSCYEINHLPSDARSAAAARECTGLTRRLSDSLDLTTTRGARTYLGSIPAQERLPYCQPYQACTQLHIGIDKDPLDFCVCPYRIPPCDHNFETHTTMAMTFTVPNSGVTIQLKFCEDIYQNKHSCGKFEKIGARVQTEGNVFARVDIKCRCRRDLFELHEKRHNDLGDPFHRREYIIACKLYKKRPVQGKISTRRTTYGNTKDMTLEATVPLDP